MKRLVRMLGICLLLTLLITATGMIANAEAAAIPLQLDTPQEVIISDHNSVCVSYTPAESGVYILKSQAEDCDPYVYLYDAEGTQIAYDDDSFGRNFTLTCQLEAGQTYTYTIGTYEGEGNFSVTLSEWMVTKVDIDPVAFAIKEIDGYWIGDPNEETGELIDGYFHYNWINCVTGTVTFKDTSTAPFVNNTFTYQGQEYRLDWSFSEEQSRENPWTVGNTYTGQISLFGSTTEVEITIIDTPITNIEIDPVVMYHQIDANWGQGSDDPDYWYSYNWRECNLTGTVTFRDDSTAQIEDGRFTYRGETIYLNCSDNQSYENQWTVGTYTPEISALNYTGTVDVTIEATPIADIEIDPVVMYQDLDTVWTDDYIEETQEWTNLYYFHYYWWDHLSGTVTFKDGSESQFTDGYITYHGNTYYLKYDNEQSYENQWTLGTYTPSFSVLNYTQEVSVTIDTIIADMEIDPITLIKEQNGWTEWEYDETGKYVGNYFLYDWWNHLNGTVSFKDGYSTQIINGRFTYRDNEYELDRMAQAMQSYENQWNVGSYTPTITILGYTQEINVTIEYELVTEIHIDLISLSKDIDGDWDWIYDDETGESIDKYFRYYWWDRISGTVTLKDGSEAILTDGHFTYQGEDYWVESCNDDQSYENQWTLGNTYTGEVVIKGCPAQAEITIIATPIASIEIDPITLIKENDQYGSWEWKHIEETDEWMIDYFRYNWYDHISGTVIFQDDSTAQIENGSIIYRGNRYYLNCNDVQSSKNPWDVGTYTPVITLLGYTQEINVTIEYELVTKITIDPITAIKGIDGFMNTQQDEETGEWIKYYHFEWWNYLNGEVKFKNGDTAAIVYGSFAYQGECYQLAWYDYQSYKNPLDMGTNTLEVSILGCYAPVSVTITNPQAEEIALDTEYNVQPEDVTGIFYAFTPEVDGNYLIYSFNKLSGDPVARLYDQNMMQLAGSDDEGGYGNFMISRTLSAGETYYLQVYTFNDQQSDYCFKVTRADVQEITLNPIVLKEGIDGYHWGADGVNYFTYDWWNHLTGSVTFANGTVSTIQGTFVNFEGMNFRLNYSTEDQNANPWIGGETYNADLEFLGSTYTVPVTIEECPIASITANPLVIKVNSNGWWDNAWTEDCGFVEWYQYDWQNLLSYTVEMKDGSVVYGTDSSFYYDGEYYSLSGNFFGGYENRMEVGNTYTRTISVMGKETSVSITIADSAWYAGFEYMVHDGNAIICGSTRTDEVLTIPQTLNGYPVVAVENLGRAVLYAKEIVIGDSVTKLGNTVFNNTAARKITLGKGIKNCNWSQLLSAKSLEQIVISSQNPALKSVDGVVYNKSATKLLFVPVNKTNLHTVPNTVTDVSALVDLAQYYENLNITFGSGVEDYVMIDGVIYNKDVTKLYSVNKNSTGSLTIPSTVTSINSLAFIGADYSEITVSPTVTDLVYGTFKGCRNLRSVTLPENLISIGNSAFAECGSLQAIVIPAGMENIQDAFIDSSVSHIFYKGTEEQWYSMEKWFDESDITVHCNATGNEMRLETEGNQLKMYCSICDEWTVISKPGNPLKLIREPLDSFAYLNETVSVNIEAEGDGLTYQWYYKNANASDFSLSAAKTSTYATTMNAGINDRQVYCVITDQYGNSITTNTVTLRMKTTLKITKQPTSVTVASGTSARVSVSASGDGLTYQWYYKNANVSKFSVSSAKTSTYATPMSTGVNGRQVYCVITDQYGNSVTTNTVTLNMQAPLTITKQPVSVTVANGAAAKVTVSATGDGLTYQWYYKNANVSKFSASAAKTSSYETAMSAGVNGRQVYCVITDQYGNTVTTNTVTINIKATITKQPASIVVANGATAKVTVSAAGEGLTYQWYYKNANASKFSASAAKTSTYGTAMSAGVNGRQVYCVITDKYGNTVTTNTVTINIKATITKQPASIVVANGATAKVTVNVAGEGLTYQWYYKNANASKFSASSAKTSTYGTAMSAGVNGRQVYCVITDKYGNTVTTNTVTLNMKATITKQPASIVVANGATAKVTVNVAGEGLTYQWYYKNKGATKFSASAAKTSTYATTMSAGVNGRQVYCVITDKYGNTVTTNTVTINIKATITKQPASIVVANGATAKVTVNVAGEGLTYQWYYKNKGATKFSASAAKTSTYATTMSAGVNGRQVYCVITDKYGNTVTTNTVTINIKATITKQPTSVTVANGKTAKVTVTAAGEGLTYQWYYKNKNASTFSASAAKTSSYATTMSAGINGRQVYCVITDKYGNTVKTNTVTLKNS